MMKRILSFLLCLVMSVSLIAPAAQAADSNIYVSEDNLDDVIVGDNVVLDNVVVDSDNIGGEKPLAPNPTELLTQTTEPANKPVFAEPDALEPEDKECNCGEDTAISDHADNCVVKAYYDSICDGSAADIYARWDRFSGDEQAYICDYLHSYHTEVNEQLQELLSGSSELEEYTAEATINGATVAVSGLPEDSALTVTEADGQHKALADDTISAALEGENTAELFSWDISVQSGENQNWQPDGTVRLEMDIPDAQLGMYTRVYVVHVDDNGVATTIEADVTDDGKIVFVSDGFSVYYGFTVDFAYQGAAYSIAGMSLILLSELFDNLNMDLDVQDVADVTFSDETLVEVKKQADGNWLLTSLKAFTTTEKLSVTMNGGQVYNITVTDATYTDPDDDPNYVPPTVTARDANGNIKATYNQGSTGKDTITWYAMNDNSNGKVHANSDGLSTDYKIVIDGTNAKGDYPFYVKLQSPQRSNSTADSPKYIKCSIEGWEDTLWINMYQLEIRGGAHVIVDVGAQFDSSIKQVYLRPSTNDTQSLFNVVNGTLEFTGDADRVIVISGKNNSYYKENPLIMISNGADGFFAQHISFRQSLGRAFLIRANELQRFELVDCEFQNSIGVGTNHLNGESELGGDGGAIRIDETSTADATGNRVDIYNFKLTRCQFKGITSNDDGGAIYTEGRIYNAVISGCTFNNCTAQQITSDGAEAYAYGGAMSIAGYMGKLIIKNTSFTGCKSYGRGGAIYFSMHKNTNNNWSRMNEITFQKCSFKNCTSRKSHGGAISTESHIHTLQILGCSFENCRANINGGAVSLGYVDLGTTFGTGSSWQEYFAGADGNDDPQYGSRNASAYQWPVDKMYRTTHKRFLVDSYTDENGVVTRSTFTDCVGQSGGGIEFARYSYTDDADIQNADFLRCRSVANGNAIYTSETVVKYLNVTNITAKYCTSMKGGP